MKLKKGLGLFGIFCVSSGAMISSGLFVLPGLVYLKVGPAAFLAYFLAGLLVIPSVLSKAELVTAMPKSGGTYFFIERSLGPGAGTLAGISAWFSLSFKSSFALMGIGAFGILLYPTLSWWEIKLIAILFCILFVIINIVGIKEAAIFQNTMVLGLIIIIIYYIVRGIPVIKLNNFENFLRSDISSLFAVVGLVFVSYGGLTKVASVAEEVKNPTRNIPLGMFLAFIIVTILYALTIFVTVGVLGDGLIKADGKPSLTPLTDAGNLMAGKAGLLLTIAALLSFISTANAGVMAASRSPMAMSRDHLLPKFFLKINKAFKTPHNSIIFTGLFMVSVIIFLDLEMLIKTASTLKLLLFSVENLAVIVMRESRIQNYKPRFKSPFYPWMQIVGILAYIFLIIDMGVVPLLISGLFMVLSLFWYIVYGRIRTNRKSALHHIIKRVIPKEFECTLESELKEIVLERDEIQKDRFDKLIENALVLDMKKSSNLEEFCHIVSDKLTSRLGLEKDAIFKKMMEREKESSTVISPELAIPHIIVEGEKLFDLMIVRCKDGIYFSEEAQKINTVFVIVGSRDERTFHLKAISAIAQIVQNDTFEKRWNKASGEQALKDTVILSDRRRFA